MSKLTEKQKMFVREYLVDLNATQAAIRAGYSDNCAGEIGYENLNKPQIQEAIKEAIDKRSKKTEITADYVLSAIQDTVNRSIADDDRQNIYKGAELLGKHLKLFTDKVDHGFDPNAPLTINLKRTVHHARDND